MLKYRECSRMRAAGEAEEAGLPLPTFTNPWANNLIVNIQPMSLPSGTIFYLDYKYGSDDTSQPRGGATVEGQSHEEERSATGPNVAVRSEGTEDPH